VLGSRCRARPTWATAGRVLAAVPMAAVTGVVTMFAVIYTAVLLPVGIGFAALPLLRTWVGWRVAAARRRAGTRTVAEPCHPAGEGRLRGARKNSTTAASSNDGEFGTSITTSAPATAAASPFPVSVSTPVFGEAATVSCLCSAGPSTSFDPISPVPPITTIFIANLLSPTASVAARRQLRQGGRPFCDPMRT
jgi:hypothetical protein